MSEAKMARRQLVRSQVLAWNGAGQLDTVLRIPPRDPETACNAFVGLHSTTTESDPGEKGPCQDAGRKNCAHCL